MGHKKRKNCPWCGEDGAQMLRGSDMRWAVVCGNWECGATGPARTARTAAIRAWNDRPTFTSARVAWRALVGLTRGGRSPF